MLIKKITSVLTSVFVMLTILFFILTHILVGEGLILPAAGLLIAGSLSYLITPVMDVGYLVVAAILLVSVIVAIVWLVKLIRVKAKFLEFFQPFIFLFSIVLTLVVVGKRDALQTLYAAEATRLTVFYLVGASLFIMAYGLHLMVFGLVRVNGLSVDANAEAKELNTLSEEEIREIVKDELSHIQPVIVKETVIKEEVVPAEEVVEETEEAEEAEEVEEVAEELVEEEVAPIEEVVEQPVLVATEGEEVEKVDFERLTFEERIASFDEDSLEKYVELKEYMLSYGVKSRISSSGDSFRANRKMFFKITNSGNSGFKVYFKLDLASYANTTFPLKDASGIKMYEEVPAFMYMKSDLSLKRCKELVDDVMFANGFVRKD